MKKKIKSNHEKYKKESFRPFYKKLDKDRKREKKERVSYLEALSNTLNLPSDILAGSPIITVIGRNEISVENYKRIIEYTDKSIKIQTNIGSVWIQGKYLKISYFANDEMKITGKFHSIHFGTINE